MLPVKLTVFGLSWVNRAPFHRFHDNQTELMVEKKWSRCQKSVARGAAPHKSSIFVAKEGRDGRETLVCAFLCCQQHLFLIYF